MAHKSRCRKRKLDALAEEIQARARRSLCTVLMPLSPAAFRFFMAGSSDRITLRMERAKRKATKH